MTKRTGIIGKKIGMTSIFIEDTKIPVTVVQIMDCLVVDQKTKERDGYTAAVLGVKKVKLEKIPKPLKHLFTKNSLEPRGVLKEFRVTADAVPQIGTNLTAEYFKADQYIDVVGHSIGKGFAGVMKRHNFRGLEATHGVSVSHRSHGSTGGRQDPGKVFKGKKMAGHLGDVRVTQQNLKIIAIKENLLLIHGSIPGAKNSYVYVSDAVKK